MRRNAWLVPVLHYNMTFYCATFTLHTMNHPEHTTPEQNTSYGQACDTSEHVCLHKKEVTWLIPDRDRENNWEHYTTTHKHKYTPLYMEVATGRWMLQICYTLVLHIHTPCLSTPLLQPVSILVHLYTRALHTLTPEHNKHSLTAYITLTRGPCFLASSQNKQARPLFVPLFLTPTH